MKIKVQILMERSVGFHSRVLKICQFNPNEKNVKIEKMKRILDDESNKDWFKDSKEFTTSKGLPGLNCYDSGLDLYHEFWFEEAEIEVGDCPP